MDTDVEFCIVSSSPKVSTVVVDVPMEEPVVLEINSDDDVISPADEEKLLDVEELSDLSGNEFLDDDIYANMPTTIEAEEVDIYQYQGLPSELNLEDELSDLSDNEQFMDKEPEQSGMSAELRQQFALCISTLQQPFQTSNTMDLPAANIE